MTLTAQRRPSVGPSSEDLARCVHCGFCLQACPTYVVTGLETESPRGRIRLARALAEGEVGPRPNVLAHLDLCLACRACESACPSGVPYGRIIEGARALVQAGPRPPLAWRLRKVALRSLFASPRRLRLLFSLLRLYQSSPLAPLARRLLPSRLRRLEATLPPLPRRFFDGGAALPAVAAPKATAALLLGCVMPLTYPAVHEATVRVLARNGIQALLPNGQGCCGALHLHNGDPEGARRLARRLIDAFLDTGADYVVVNAAGCGSAMKEYGHLFAADPTYAEKATRFAAKVRDVTEILVETGFRPPAGRVPSRVTYQDACHLAHAQRIREAPRRLLRSIPGLELVEMEAPDRCCGSAGVYNLTQPAMSRRLLEEKMDDLLATGCEVIATANPGCIIQLQLGAKLRNAPQPVQHVVELLDRAYEAEADSAAQPAAQKEG